MGNCLGLDRFGFPARFSPPVTLQIITQGQLNLALARHCSQYQNSSVKHLASLSLP